MTECTANLYTILENLFLMHGLKYPTALLLQIIKHNISPYTTIEPKQGSV